MIRTTLIFLVVIAVTACSGDVNTPTAHSRDPQRPHGVAMTQSIDQATQTLIDDFFKRFPSPRETELREMLSTKRSRLTSNNPDQQRAIDDIYKSLARSNKAVKDGQGGSHYALPPGVSYGIWKPDAATVTLIQEFLDRFPPAKAVRYRQAIFTSNVMMSMPNDAESQKLLTAIYRAKAESGDDQWDFGIQK